MLKELLENSIINKIKNSTPVFILILGGPASGKNFIYEKYFNNFDLVDVDKIVKSLGGTLENYTDFIGPALKIAKEELIEHFENNKSVVQVSNGANIKGTYNKFLLAEKYNFNTALILVDTDVQIALKRNKERASKGLQLLVPNEKVIANNKKARDTFNELKNKVDFNLIIKN